MFDLCISFTFKRRPHSSWGDDAPKETQDISRNIHLGLGSVKFTAKQTEMQIFYVNKSQSRSTKFPQKPSPASLGTPLAAPVLSNYFATIFSELFVAAVLWLPS